MDSKKMAAFAGPAPDASDGPASATGKAPGISGDEDGASRFDGAIPALQQHAQELENVALELADQIDPIEALDVEFTPDDDAIDLLTDSYDNLDDDLVEALTQTAGMNPDEARDLAQRLADEGAIQDVDACAAWLFLVANHVLHSEPADDAEMPEEDDLEDPEVAGGGFGE